MKEGICQDPEFQTPLSKLLYFETSKNQTSELASLDEYISRMRPEQKDIYYLCSPTRDAALNSPYLEAFEKADVEVLFMYTAIEDFVMANLQSYEGRNLVSAEKSDIDLSELIKDNTDGEDENKKKVKAKRTGRVELTDKELRIVDSVEKEKEYEVEVEGTITAGRRDKLEDGVRILGEETKPTTIKLVTKNTMRIIITEGKNRQIRRICRKVGIPVVSLKRIRMNKLWMDSRLEEGDWRDLTEQELKQLLG